MNQDSFHAEACHTAFRNKVAVLYGDSPETERMDSRQLFYLELLHRVGMLAAGKHLLDLGAGLSAFGPVASAMGMQVSIADDFGGGGGVVAKNQAEVRALITGWKERLGIRVIESDILSQPLPLETASVDVVTCINSLEHWHHSPKRLFAEVSRVLRPQGHLILVTPNAANLRKRVSALGGKNIWDRLDWWYHDGDPVFRGHVREPIIADLKKIMEWNDFTVIHVCGRNFLGQRSKALGFLPPLMLQRIVAAADWLLRLRPTLCSDIHVIGRKQA
jgi:SAM-dependent methyltransferase